MINIEMVLNRIRAYRRERGWCITKMARESGITEAAIRKMDSPSWAPSSTTIRKMESAIPCDYMPK